MPFKASREVLFRETGQKIDEIFGSIDLSRATEASLIESVAAIDAAIAAHPTTLDQLFWRFEAGLRLGGLFYSEAARIHRLFDDISDAAEHKDEMMEAAEQAFIPLADLVSNVADHCAIGAGSRLAYVADPDGQRAATRRRSFLVAVVSANTLNANTKNDFIDALTGAAFTSDAAIVSPAHRSYPERLVEKNGGAANLGGTLRASWLSALETPDSANLALARWASTDAGRSFFGSDGFKPALRNISLLHEQPFDPGLRAGLACGDTLALSLCPWMGPAGADNRVWTPTEWAAYAFECVEGRATQTDPDAKTLERVQEALALAMLVSPYGEDWAAMMARKEPATHARLCAWAERGFGADFALQGFDGRQALSEAQAMLARSALNLVILEAQPDDTAARRVVARKPRSL
jgi:hypothetical protein